MQLVKHVIVNKTTILNSSGSLLISDARSSSWGLVADDRGSPHSSELAEMHEEEATDKPVRQSVLKWTKGWLAMGFLLLYINCRKARVINVNKFNSLF